MDKATDFATSIPYTSQFMCVLVDPLLIQLPADVPVRERHWICMGHLGEDSDSWLQPVSTQLDAA